MNDFKIGDEVVCVDSDAYLNITKGNTYPVLDVCIPQILIKNDDNSTVWYPKKLFTTIWKPKVGEPCMRAKSEVVPIFVGVEHVVFIENGAECVNNIKYFSPLKTTAEIERENAITELVKIINGGDGDKWSLDLANKLYDAGCRKQDVKPLSEVHATHFLGLKLSVYKRLVECQFIIQGGE